MGASYRKLVDPKRKFTDTAVARALAGDPSIVLAGEPTGNLDSANGEAVMELLNELNRAGSTICVVTHDPRYAAHANRAIHLLNGRVVNSNVAAVRRQNIGQTAPCPCGGILSILAERTPHR